MPLRIEVGPKDYENKSAVAVRRDTGAKTSLPIDSLVQRVPELLDNIHGDMLAKADAQFREHRKVVLTWEEFTPTLNEKNHVIIPWCEVSECEDDIKDRSARISLAGEAQDERAPSMGCLLYTSDAADDLTTV